MGENSCSSVTVTILAKTIEMLSLSLIFYTYNNKFFFKCVQVLDLDDNRPKWLVNSYSFLIAYGMALEKCKLFLNLLSFNIALLYFS